MPVRRASATALYIEKLAEQYHVVYRQTPTDRLAHQFTRLAGDDANFDPIEEMLIGLQRAGRIDRKTLIQLQAQYLREISQ
jgi:hypothetical protein